MSVRWGGLVAGAVLVLGTVACSGGNDQASSSSAAGVVPESSPPVDSASLSSLVTAECTPGTPALRIEQIPDAVAAVEAELGGPQRYFEINATDVLVNLFVASPDATKVTPYVFAAGALTSKDTTDAQGNTFEASALDIDPESVSSCIAAQLPTSSQDLFLVEGGPGGAVRYTILTTSANGGQLLVEVRGDGTVLSVDPVDG